KRTQRQGAERLQLTFGAASPERNASCRTANRLRDGAASPRVRDECPKSVHRRSIGQPWRRKAYPLVQAPDRIPGSLCDALRNTNAGALEFELDGRPGEEAIGAVKDAQLEQLSLRSRPRLARHGRQYTHAPMPSPQPGSPSMSVLREAVTSTFDRYLAELEE